MRIMLMASALMQKKAPIQTIFLGQVSPTDFITGAALSSLVGLSSGSLVSGSTDWLKFVDGVDGKTKYISKRPVRNNLSWDNLNTRNLTSGTKTIVISGKQYIIRLPRAFTDELSPPYAAGEYDAPFTHGSEWNRLMYRVSGKPFGEPLNTLASEGISEGDLAKFTELDLFTRNQPGAVGTFSFCGGVFSNQSTIVPTRGNKGVSHTSGTFKNTLNVNLGWRPLLELIG